MIDVPRAVTLNIGRKIQASLEQPASLSQLQRTFSEVEADRISKESRKVLRLASWELREQFRKAFEASTQHCADAQHSQNTSQHALHWLQTLVQDLEQQKSQLQRVDLDA